MAEALGTASVGDEPHPPQPHREFVNIMSRFFPPADLYAPKPVPEGSFPYAGSCHCNFVRYTVILPSPVLNPHAKRADGSPVFPLQVEKCNCSICYKAGTLHLRSPEGAKSFTLISPSSLSELGMYTFKEGITRHCFCPKCGVRPFNLGDPEKGDLGSWVSVNAITVEPDQEGWDAKSLEVWYFNGRGWKGPVTREPVAGSVW